MPAEDAINEQQAARAFSMQAPTFDELYGADKIIQYKRNRVRQQVLRNLPAQASILELNSGTGEDAIFFAGLGHQVHATDISAGMQERLQQKIKASGLTEKVSSEMCSFTNLKSLKNKGPYNLVFSNFAGLNCSNDLGSVLDSFDHLLKPGGLVTLVVLPKFCLWEFLLIFKGKFKTATRRFFSDGGRQAKVNDVAFTCWYYSPKYILNRLKDNYQLLHLEGLCTIVPPSYLENFAEKYPGLFSFLVKKENKLKSRWPWKLIGDYYIITLKKKL